MKRSLLCFFILFIITLSNVSLPKGYSQERQQLKNRDHFPKTISLQDKLYTLSMLWSELKYNYVNMDQITFDADSLYKETISTIISSSNDIDYYDILERYIASFQDAHTQLLDVNYDWNEYFDYIPCNLECFDDKIYFTRIRQTQFMDSTLLGAEIIEINGVPTKEYAEQEYFSSIPSKNYQAKLYFASIKMMQGLEGESFTGKARKMNGQVVPFSIIYNGETTRTKNDKYWKIIESTPWKKNDLVFQDSIAILTMNTFDDRIQDEVDSLFNLIIAKKPQGLIIDLRKNRGGSTDVALNVQKYLTPGDFFLSFGAQTRAHHAYGKAQGNYRKEYEAYYEGKAYKLFPPDTIWINK